MSNDRPNRRPGEVGDSKLLNYSQGVVSSSRFTLHLSRLFQFQRVQEKGDRKVTEQGKRKGVYIWVKRGKGKRAIKLVWRWKMEWKRLRTVNEQHRKEGKRHKKWTRKRGGVCKYHIRKCLSEIKKYPTFWRSWAAKSLLAAELQQVSWVSYRDLLYSLLDFRAWKGNEIITPALGYTFKFGDRQILNVTAHVVRAIF